MQLGDIDRCRKLYQKYLECSPESCYAWTEYAELERSLCETDRARAIFELATTQCVLDTPELLWKVTTATPFLIISLFKYGIFGTCSYFKAILEVLV